MLNLNKLNPSQFDKNILEMFKFQSFHHEVWMTHVIATFVYMQRWNQEKENKKNNNKLTSYCRSIQCFDRKMNWNFK